jgi:hypothetical protein
MSGLAFGSRFGWDDLDGGSQQGEADGADAVVLQGDLHGLSADKPRERFAVDKDGATGLDDHLARQPWRRGRCRGDGGFRHGGHYAAAQVAGERLAGLDQPEFYSPRVDGLVGELNRHGVAPSRFGVVHRGAAEPRELPRPGDQETVTAQVSDSPS